MLLVGQLYLDDELLPTFIPAHHVESCVPVPGGHPEQLCRQICDVLYPLVREDRHQKRHKELLVHLRPEKPLESPVVQRVDVPWQRVFAHFVAEPSPLVFQKCAAPAVGTQVAISINSHKDSSF